VTEAIYQRTTEITEWRAVEAATSISTRGHGDGGADAVEVIDPWPIMPR
jgi:hypothetical protein